MSAEFYTAHILIVEDDPVDARFFEHVLHTAGHAVTCVSNTQSALDALMFNSFALVLVDLTMTDMGGMQFLELVKRYYPGLPVIIITAHASVGTAVRAMRLGASSYFAKGDPAERLLEDVESVICRTCHTAERYMPAASQDAHRLTARGVLFSSLLSTAGAVARAGRNLLVVGNRGSGRSALGYYMHATGARTGRLVEVDCAANAAETLSNIQHGETPTGKPATLVLRGLEDASPPVLRPVLDALAEFLDQTDSPPQVVSLVSPMGAWQLHGAYGARRYAQFWSLSLALPDLPERREDIFPALDALRKRYNSELGTRVEGISPELAETLVLSAYIDNFIGLETLLARMMLHARVGMLTPAHLLSEIAEGCVLVGGPAEETQLTGPSVPGSLKEARGRAEADYIRMVMNRTGNNRSRAAAVLGISSRQLYNMLKKYDMD